MDICCLDLEGVLVPEIWIEVADHYQIEDLRATTRDIPDYDELMRGRLEILDRHGISLPDIQKVIADMGPLPGARGFLDWLREEAQVILLSDTFYEFAMPLMRQLGYPTLLCHSLECDKDGRVTDYRLRHKDSKLQAVQALRQLGFSIVAAGDSYNDTAMLTEADHGFLFRPPQSVREEFPDLPVATNYRELQTGLERVLN